MAIPASTEHILFSGLIDSCVLFSATELPCACVPHYVCIFCVAKNTMPPLGAPSAGIPNLPSTRCHCEWAAQATVHFIYNKNLAAVIVTLTG